MIEYNKPIVDTRTTVTGNQPPITGYRPANAAQQPGGPKTTGNGNNTPSEKNSTTPQAMDTPETPHGSSSSATTKVATVEYPGLSTTIPDEFKGSSNQELIDFLEKKINEHKPLSDADVAKIRRRQKAEGIISGISDAAQAVANLIATHHYAPNMYNPTEGMSAKAKARFEKEKAERQAEDDKFFNYAITLGRLRDADKARGLQAWQTEQSLVRQDRAFDAGRKDREDDIAFRNKDFDERIRQWQENFDRQGEWHQEEGLRWERQFKESTRQFNVSAANERARIGLESQRLAHAMKEGQMTFNLGSGNGNVTLTLDRLNAQTVSRIYNTLPTEVRSQVQGDPIVQNGFVVGYKPPTTEAMLIAIGANVESSPATQNAIRQVAGLEKGDKPKLY